MGDSADDAAYAIGQQLTRVLTVIVVSGALLSLLGGIMIIFLRNRESRHSSSTRTRPRTVELERIPNKSQLLSREKLDTFPVIVFKVENKVVQNVTIEYGEKTDYRIYTNESTKNDTATDNAQTNNNTTIPTANHEQSVPSPTRDVSEEKQAREEELTSCVKNEKNDNDDGDDNKNVVEEDNKNTVEEDNKNTIDKTIEEDSKNKSHTNEHYHVDFPTTCVICLEDFQDGDELRQLPCFHQYHIKCIDPWLMQKSPACPMCKHDCNQDFVPFKKNAGSSDGDVISDNDTRSSTISTTSAISSFFTRTSSTATIQLHDIDSTASQEDNESHDVNSRSSLQLSLTISSSNSHSHSHWSWSSSRSSKSISIIEPPEIVIDKMRDVSSDIGDENNKDEEVELRNITVS